MYECMWTFCRFRFKAEGRDRKVKDRARRLSESVTERRHEEEWCSGADMPTVFVFSFFRLSVLSLWIARHCL
jgi:hypothetical protein